MRAVLFKHTPLLLLALLAMAFAAYSPEFRTSENLQSVALRTSVIGIIAIGELLVILTGAIDLSVGSLAALAGVVGCAVMKAVPPEHPTAAVLIGIAVGTLTGSLAGGINGFLVAAGRIPAFIVTLGMMMMARGLTLLLSKGQPIFGLPAAFSWLGGAQAWWVPAGFCFGLTLATAVVLAFTSFGRALYAVGGNLEAARLSGLPVQRTRIAAFTWCGTLSGFAGMMLASRTSIASPTAAEMYELDAIAACVIGGASLMGGEGNALATLAGALIMMVLRNFCNLENLDVYWQQVLVGALLIVLVFYDSYQKRAYTGRSST
jgi:ribose/xylose/arabinose/galactoside ABC-type transport system permease subunit